MTLCHHHVCNTGEGGGGEGVGGEGLEGGGGGGYPTNDLTATSPFVSRLPKAPVPSKVYTQVTDLFTTFHALPH